MQSMFCDLLIFPSLCVFVVDVNTGGGRVRAAAVSIGDILCQLEGGASV